MCRFCNVWLCVCMGFVVCGCCDNCVGVLVICVLVFTVFLCCFVCVYLFFFVARVRTTAIEWKIDSVNNNNNNNNNNNIWQVVSTSSLGPCTRAWWWPKLDVETSCQIKKRSRKIQLCVAEKIVINLRVTPTGMFHIKIISRRKNFPAMWWPYWS